MKRNKRKVMTNCFQCISSSIHGYEDNTNDYNPNISHDIKEIPSRLIDEQPNLWEIYLNLKERLEGTSMETT